MFTAIGSRIDAAVPAVGAWCLLAFLVVLLPTVIVVEHLSGEGE
jgi:hypothetical protein